MRVILVIVRLLALAADTLLRHIANRIIYASPLGALRSATGAYRVSRAIYVAYEEHKSVRWLVRRLGSHITVRRRMLYYRGVLRRFKEFRNTWSRGVVGGFVNLNFVGDQPPVHHGNARVSLIVHGRKIPMKPSKHRRQPPQINGGARFRSRLKRSVLGV